MMLRAEVFALWGIPEGRPPGVGWFVGEVAARRGAVSTPSRAWRAIFWCKPCQQTELHLPNHAGRVRASRPLRVRRLVVADSRRENVRGLSGSI